MTLYTVDNFKNLYTVPLLTFLHCNHKRSAEMSPECNSTLTELNFELWVAYLLINFGLSPPGWPPRAFLSDAVVCRNDINITVMMRWVMTDCNHTIIMSFHCYSTISADWKCRTVFTVLFVHTTWESLADIVRLFHAAMLLFRNRVICHFVNAWSHFAGGLEVSWPINHSLCTMTSVPNKP